MEPQVQSGQVPVTVSLKDLEAGSVPLPTLLEAFGPSSLGILIVKDLPPQYAGLRHRLLSYSSYLANLPPDELELLEDAAAKYLTGWSLGKESLKPNVPDTLKGSYYINCAFAVSPTLSGAPSTSPDGTRDFSAYTEYTAPNRWPREEVLPAFRATAQELCGLVIGVAALVARACDRFADQEVQGYERGYLERMVRASMTTKARLLHYFPPKEQEGEGGGGTEDGDEDDWCATHVDHGCLTGLTSAMYVDETANPPTLATSSSAEPPSPLPELAQPPDPQTGLYIHSRAGAVTKVAIPRDCLAFQTGEALERITRGAFRAVPHFVRGAGKSKDGGGPRIARNTLAVFTQPNLWEMVDVDRGLDYAGFAREVVERHY